MQRDFTFQKRLIMFGVGLLLVADLGLAAYSWRLSSSPRTPRQQLARESSQLELLRADLRRASDIRAKMPDIQKDCDKFEREKLKPASVGYSAISAELGSIASKSALHIDDLSFHPKEIPNRGLQMVEMEATVTGDYTSVVRFLNGLQRSESVYEVDGLTLTADSQSHAGGALRVNLRMKTYFRDAA
jgi:type IV pilus assembly protein PilO